MLKSDETRVALRTKIGEVAGYISMCWDPKPSGRFDGGAAGEALDGVDAFVKAHEAQILEDHNCLTQEQAEKVAEFLRATLSNYGPNEGLIQIDGSIGWFIDWKDRVEKGGTDG